jgi:hypothetical protein
MTPDAGKRPWYKLRWQIWLILSVAVVSSAYLFSKGDTTPEIPATSGPVGLDKTPKQRMLFARSLDNSFRKKGWHAFIDVDGEDGKTLKIYWPELNLSMVKEIVHHQKIISDIREMGFKQLVLRNNSKAWNIDLKN